MRLIDADREWSEEASDNTGYRLEYENGMFVVYDDMAAVLCEFMPDLPTAYNVDKVVEELKKEKRHADGKCRDIVIKDGHSLEYEFYNGKSIGIEKGMEIVKGRSEE